MKWNDGSSHFDVQVHGTIEFTEDLTDVASMSDGGYLKLRDWSSLIPRTIEIQSRQGAVVRRFYVGGLERPFDDAARHWLAERLPILVRRSGLGAEHRVKSIFEKKGLSGVLDEINLLGGDYARRRYFIALVDTARFDSVTIKPALLQVGQHVASDYERGQVLQHIASHVPLDQSAGQSYLRAVAGMKSDYERRRALSALLIRRPIPAGMGALVVSGAEDMHSDYERSELLRAVLASGKVEQDDSLFAAVGRMGSSYEKRRVLSDMLTRNGLSSDARRGFLMAAATIDSDYDCAEVLTAYLKASTVDNAVRQPFFGALTSIGSDYERRRVLTALAAKGATSREVQQSAFDLVARMRSDYDRAEVLLAFLNAHAVQTDTRQAFVTAAERITSSHDQNRVLAALVRAERR